MNREKALEELVRKGRYYSENAIQMKKLTTAESVPGKTGQVCKEAQPKCMKGGELDNELRKGQTEHEQRLREEIGRGGTEDHYRGRNWEGPGEESYLKEQKRG